MSHDPLVAHVRSDPANRITLPKHCSHRAPFQGSESFDAWLLLLSPGRYRLLTDEQVQSDPHLEPVRSLILEGKSPVPTEPTLAEEPTRAAIVARLLPTTISPQGPNWRISFPKAFDPFVPPECDAKEFSILFSLEGYWEIWYRDVLRRAVVLPLGSQQ
jgi:hypothetical protein